MPLTYNLPAVTNDPMPAPAGYGTWEIATDLRGLADSLRIGVVKGGIGDIKSMPDAWAQGQISGQALFTPGHELHSAILSQWRGLLALFALHPFYEDQYDLEILAMSLSGPEATANRLRRVLNSLLPSVKLLPRLSWENTGAIMFRDKSGGAFSRGESKPIGLLSPWTLVFPGKSALAITHPHVPWLVDGLRDPISVNGLASEHFAVLARYLESLVEAVAAGGAREHDHDAFGLFSRLLEQYHSDAVARVTERLNLVPYAERRNWPDAQYEMLGNTWELAPEEIPVGDSWAKLQLRPEAIDARGAPLFDGVVLIDPEFARTCGKSPEAIRIWERYTLRDALSAQSLANIKKDAVAKNYLVLEPKDFFATKLIKFGTGVDISGHPPTLRSSLLPLSPLALMLFDVADLAAAISLRDAGGNHEISLRLPLVPDSRRGKTNQHVLTKVYTDEDVSIEKYPDDLSLWPNFRVRHWKWTFLHYQYNPRNELQTRFALSADFLCKDIATNAQGGANRARLVAEWSSPIELSPDDRMFRGRTSEIKTASGELMMTRLRFADDPDVVGELQRLPLGAEAVFFAQREGDKGSEVPVGCCLVKWPAHHEGQANAVVSIDFGTTNTVAYIKRGAAAPQPVTFQDRLLFPIRMAQNEVEQRDELIAPYADFFPLRDQQTPLPTVAKMRRFIGGAPPNVRPTAAGGSDTYGFSDVNFFVPAYGDNGGVTRLLGWIDGSDLIFGIKWSREENVRRLIRRYLRQFMLMSAAELVAEGVQPQQITWRYSYPQAFSDREAGHLQSQVLNAWRELFGDLPDFADASPATYLQPLTEGEAAFRYFTRDPEQRYVAIGEILVVFDIGGGSTDVAITYKEELCWRGSFKIAGGLFFTRYLANNRNILDRLDFTELSAYLREHTDADEKIIDSFIELFVNDPRFAQRLDQRYAEFAAEPEGEGLRHCASVALGGLMHYVGLVIGQFVAEGRIDASSLPTLTIALGGRGSTLFKQFNVGPVGKTDLARLCMLIPAAAGVEGFDLSTVNVQTLFSRQPKHEVARGLLVDRNRAEVDNRQAEAPPLWHSAPLGEAVKVSGASTSFDAASQIDDLIGARDIDVLELDGLSAFLADLSTQAGLIIDPAAAGRGGLKYIRQLTTNAVRNRLRELTVEDRDHTDTQSLEPPFITALRGLIELMNRPIADRNRSLLVKDVSQ